MIRDFLYTPINTVKPVADEVWIVDGPETKIRQALAKRIVFISSAPFP